MKTKYLLIIIVLFFKVKAQPTVTSADIINGTFQFTEISFNQGVYNPGNGGANVTWDFSNVQGTVGGVKLLYGNCSSAVSECAPFPTANRYVVSVDNNGNQSNDKNLFRVTSTQFEALGARNNVTNFTLTYTDPPIELKFPATYLQSFTDTSSYTANGVTTHTNDVITVDGYGTVKTPVGTYTNVLRVKKESTVNISMGGSTVSTTHITRYTWYKNNREQIAGFSVSNMTFPVPQALPSTFQYTTHTNLAVKETSAEKPAIVYPNPTEDGKVWVDTKHRTKSISIYDMTGKKIFSVSGNQMKPVEGKYMINLQNYPNGNYIIKTETDQNTVSHTIQLIQK